MATKAEFHALAEQVFRFRKRAMTLRLTGRIDGMAHGADPSRLADINEEIADKLDGLYLSLR